MSDGPLAPDPVYRDPRPAPDVAQAKAEQTPAPFVLDDVEAAVPVLTADPSGVPAAQAFGELVDAAKFTLRESGHTHIVELLDGMFAGLLRLEAAIAG